MGPTFCPEHARVRRCTLPAYLEPQVDDGVPFQARLSSMFQVRSSSSTFSFKFVEPLLLAHGVLQFQVGST